MVGSGSSVSLVASARSPRLNPSPKSEFLASTNCLTKTEAPSALVVTMATWAGGISTKTSDGAGMPAVGGSLLAAICAGFEAAGALEPPPLPPPLPPHPFSNNAAALAVKTALFKLFISTSSDWCRFTQAIWESTAIVLIYERDTQALARWIQAFRFKP